MTRSNTNVFGDSSCDFVDCWHQHDPVPRRVEIKNGFKQVYHCENGILDYVIENACRLSQPTGVRGRVEKL